MTSTAEELGWVIHPGPMTVDSVGEFVRRLKTMRGAGDICLVVDRHYTSIPAIVELVRLLEANFPVQIHLATSDEAELISQIRRAGVWSLVVGVGGGVALDVAKLVALDNVLMQVVTLRGRSSRVLLPELRGQARSASVALVPSTFGTGSELSLSACISVHGRKRLISGLGLGADLVLARPSLLASLDDRQVAEGLVEIALRLSTVYASGRPAIFADALTRAALKQLSELASRVLSGDRSAVDLAALASLSAFSHAGWLTRDRGPIVTLPWILVTELSLAWSCSKAVAAASLLPGYWKVMERGNERLGSFDRLSELWRDAAPNAASPAEALRVLAGGLLCPPHENVPIAVDIDTIVSRVFSRWGAGLPYMGEIGRSEVQEVLTAAFDKELATLT